MIARFRGCGGSAAIVRFGNRTTNIQVEKANDVKAVGA
jgi:hypothetical protein